MFFSALFLQAFHTPPQKQRDDNAGRQINHFKVLISPDKVLVIDIRIILFKIKIGKEAGMGGDAGQNDFYEHKDHNMVHHDRKSVSAQILYGAAVPGSRRE